MAKKDMDLYHSRLTPDDLNDLTIKYKIPRDLHPRLPTEGFVMSELLDDAIGIYHQIFDFFGVRIPFSLFLLALIKHYKVHFSQLGPLGLNKVITFEVLCRSLQIEPTVTLFRVFQTLFKQALEECLFLIDRRAILDAMVWRHPDAAIDDPRHAAGSFNMANVRRMSAHVIKLRDMPEGVLVLSGLSRVWKNRFYDPVLRGVNRNVMGIHDFLCLPEWTGAEVQEEPHLDDLAAGTPSSKILAKAEASQKRKASTSGAASSHNQGGNSVAPTAEALTPETLGVRAIWLMMSLHLLGGVSRQRPSSGPAPSFRDVFSDVIHIDFFPFSAGPYYATYPDDHVAENCEFTREEWDAQYRTSFEVLTKEMSVLHCMMMSHGDELLASYRGLNNHEYVLSTNSRLKGYEEKVVGLTGLKLQVSTLKKQVSGLNDKLATSDASFAKSKAKGKERKKKIKPLSKIMDNLHSEMARFLAALNHATILEAKRDEEILRLKVSHPQMGPGRNTCPEA
uniref:Transposase (putative) gypsy type domain-containing protein n=1 Tax=Tanacetum cinerariifolium TaxID=118510 RepID=A0A6L2M624_TANCI|nr:hypothetical protein [Tanacetum cinerariifolium]